MEKKSKLGVRSRKIMQNFIVVAHPQENGQVEVLKRIMVDGLKK